MLIIIVLAVAAILSITADAVLDWIGEEKT